MNVGYENIELKKMICLWNSDGGMRRDQNDCNPNFRMYSGHYGYLYKQPTYFYFPIQMPKPI